MAQIRRGAFKPTEDQKRTTLHDSIWYKFVFAFGVPAHDPSDYCAWETVNFTRMGHARALYTFFETSLAKRRYEDDVLAEDYGFEARQIELAEEDRMRLNTDLFHMTYARLRHTPQTKPWPNTILANLHVRSLEFITYILGRQQFFTDGSELPKWTALLDCLRSGREFKISASVGPDGRPTYFFGLGSPLLDGKPALTRLVAVTAIR